MIQGWACRFLCPQELQFHSNEWDVEVLVVVNWLVNRDWLRCALVMVTCSPFTVS